MSYLGSKIKELRQKKGLSLRELGDQINMNYSHLSRLENGLKVPSLETVELLAGYFGVRPSYFFEEEATELTIVEEDLMKDLDLPLDGVKDKYNLTFEGRPVTDEELNDILTYLKVKRAKK